ncbi:hypothetical protein MYX19_02850 [Nitrospinae bacterium AH-259-F20]|nr:hypothetical protein [Nitrospinae bacterium AH-259-F20]
MTELRLPLSGPVGPVPLESELLLTGPRRLARLLREREVVEWRRWSGAKPPSLA